MRQQPIFGNARQYGAGLVLLGLYVATIGVLKAFSNDSDPSFCSFGLDGGWAACDQPYHIQQIDYFIQHPENWLHYPDPWQTATFPGFHLLVALMARLLGVEALSPDSWFRIIPFFFGLLALGVLWRAFRGLSQNGHAAVVLCLPILWSNYFYLPSLFLVTESAAYLGYSLLLLAYLEFPRRSAFIGLTGAATVFVRQIFLPVTLTPLVLAFFQSWQSSAAIRRLLVAIGPGLLLFALYYFAWGGPVPHEELGEHGGHALLEPGPVIQSLGLLGVLAVPYGFITLPALRALGPRRILAIAIGAAFVALLVWVLLPTTRDLEAGRAGSVIWILARSWPLDSFHAPLVLPCLMAGCAALGAIIEFARARRYWPIELVMFALYVAGLSLQRLSYQRYSEFVTLVLLSATAARCGSTPRLGIAMFVAVFAAKLVVTLSMPQGG